MSLSQEQINKIAAIVATGAGASKATAEESQAANDYLVATAEARIASPEVGSEAFAHPVLGATVARTEAGNVVVRVVAIRKSNGLRMVFGDTFYGV